MASGFFVVPLNTLIQARSEPSYRARIIAANNILNALFMVVGAIIAAVLIKLGLSVPEIFLVFGVLNLLAALYSFRLLPETAVKELCAGFLRLLYRVELRGIENYATAGERVVIVANHVSFLDAGADRVLPAGTADLRRRFLRRPALVGEALPPAGRQLLHRPGPAARRPIADQGRRGRPALRDLPRRAHHRDRRADEDL